MDEIIEEMIHFILNNQNKDNDDIINLMVKEYEIEQLFANDLILFISVSASHSKMKEMGVLFPFHYYRIINNDKELYLSYKDNEIYTSAMSFIQLGNLQEKAILELANRSPDFKGLIELLDQGSKIDDISIGENHII